MGSGEHIDSPVYRATQCQHDNAVALQEETGQRYGGKREEVRNGGQPLL